MAYKNILIIKTSAIGDVIHALPTLHALRGCFPQARISWIVDPRAYNILENNPFLDEILIYDRARLREEGVLSRIRYLAQLSRELKARKFDLVLDLQGLAKSAVIAFLTGARTRYGQCGMRELSGLISKPICGRHRQGHVIQQYLDVARYFGAQASEVVFPIAFTREEEEFGERFLTQAGITPGKDVVIALFPGAAWPTKRWSPEKFAVLGNALQERGYKVVLLGGRDDTAAAKIITGAMSFAPADAVGKTTLKQLASIIRRCDVFVGGDSGPMHLAAAVGTPVVALFGATDPARNGPYGSGHVVVTANVPCRPCWKRRCAAIECMQNINPEEALAAIGSLTAAQSGLKLKEAQ